MHPADLGPSSLPLSSPPLPLPALPPVDPPPSSRCFSLLASSALPPLLPAFFDLSLLLPPPVAAVAVAVAAAAAPVAAAGNPPCPRHSFSLSLSPPPLSATIRPSCTLLSLLPFLPPFLLRRRPLLLLLLPPRTLPCSPSFSFSLSVPCAFRANVYSGGQVSVYRVTCPVLASDSNYYQRAGHHRG